MLSRPPPRSRSSTRFLQAVDQIFAAALDRLLENRRIGHDEVGRRQRVDKLARVELRLVVGLRIDTLDAAHG